METLENALVQANPLDQQRVLNYTIFLVDGELPLTVNDLQGLWREWRDPKGQPNYNRRWIKERDKFQKLFQDYIALEQEGKLASLCVVTPEKPELIWRPTTNRTVVSQRGQLLQKILRVLQPRALFGVAIVLQYQYNDRPEIFRLVGTRTLDSISAQLRLDQGSQIAPILTKTPIALSVLQDFWYYFRQNNTRLQAKYGTSSKAPSVDFQRHQKLYQQSNFSEFFNRLVELDTLIPATKQLMASFIHDGGFQLILHRLLTGDFDFGMLPATSGTKLLISKAPKDIRILVRALYVEN